MAGSIGQASKESWPGALAEQVKIQQYVCTRTEVYWFKSETNVGLTGVHLIIYLSRHESVKIQQYVGIKFGKDVANKIKYSKMETAVTQSEGSAFGLKEEMES